MEIFLPCFLPCPSFSSWHNSICLQHERSSNDCVGLNINDCCWYNRGKKFNFLGDEKEWAFLDGTDLNGMFGENLKNFEKIEERSALYENIPKEFFPSMSIALLNWKVSCFVVSLFKDLRTWKWSGVCFKASIRKYKASL